MEQYRLILPEGILEILYSIRVRNNMDTEDIKIYYKGIMYNYSDKFLHNGIFSKEKKEKMKFPESFFKPYESQEEMINNFIKNVLLNQEEKHKGLLIEIDSKKTLIKFEFGYNVIINDTQTEEFKFKNLEDYLINILKGKSLNLVNVDFLTEEEIVEITEIVSKYYIYRKTLKNVEENNDNFSNISSLSGRLTLWLSTPPNIKLNEEYIKLNSCLRLK